MAVSKQWVEGPVTVSLEASGGQASLSANVSVSAGGGPLAGFAKFSSANSISVSDQVLVDAGFEVAKEKFPQFSSEIALVQGLIDASIAKI